MTNLSKEFITGFSRILFCNETLENCTLKKQILEKDEHLKNDV